MTSRPRHAPTDRCWLRSGTRTAAQMPIVKRTCLRTVAGASRMCSIWNGQSRSAEGLGSSRQKQATKRTRPHEATAEDLGQTVGISIAVVSGASLATLFWGGDTTLSLRREAQVASRTSHSSFRSATAQQSGRFQQLANPHRLAHTAASNVRSVPTRSRHVRSGSF